MLAEEKNSSTDKEVLKSCLFVHQAVLIKNLQEFLGAVSHISKFPAFRVFSAAAQLNQPKLKWEDFSDLCEAVFTNKGDALLTQNEEVFAKLHLEKWLGTF